MKCIKTKLNSAIAIGSLLIIVAILFILSTLGIVDENLSRLIISWQALIFIVGIIILFTKHLFNAAIFIITGTYFLIPLIYKIYNVPLPFSFGVLTNLFIALLIISVGLGIIFGRRYFKHKKDIFIEIKLNKKGLPVITNAFAQNNHTFIEKPFKGAIVSTAFGQTTIDMSKTILDEGDSYIDINTAFGSSLLLVPKSYSVIISVTSAFGSVDDKRQSKLSDTQSRLIIRGGVAFGLLEIDNSDDEYQEITEREEVDQIESISVKHNNRVFIINIDDLQYIQADGDYVTLCTSEGKYLKEQTMKYFQSVLPSDKFVRIHRSYIVNIAEINSIDCRGKETYYVVLKDGSSLRASISGYQILKEKLEI